MINIKFFSSNTKSIYGQEEKLSESIQYLKKKTVLKDTNISFFVNENKKNDKLVLIFFFSFYYRLPLI